MVPGMLRATPRLLLKRGQKSARVLGGVSGSRFGPGNFNPQSEWFFWTPPWGSQHDQQHENEVRKAKKMEHTFWRQHKPWEYGFSQPMVSASRSSKFYDNESMGGKKLGIHWATRMSVPSGNQGMIGYDNALEIEGTFVCCWGQSGGINACLDSEPNDTPNTQKFQGHFWQWIFLPPGAADGSSDPPVVSCTWCKLTFKRKKGWAPPFAEDLLPTHGLQPNSLDPVLEGVKNGEARVGKFTVPAPIKLKPTQKSSMQWHCDRAN